MIIGFAGLGMIVPSLMFLTRHPGLIPDDYLSADPIGLMVIAAIALTWASMTNAPLNRMIEDAKNARDKRKVGILLDALQEYTALVQSAQYRTRSDRRRPDFSPLVLELTQILASILPQIEAGDAVLFTPAQRKTLHLLLSNQEATVVLNTLHALGEIGNKADLAMIRHLAAGAWQASVDPGLAHTAAVTADRIQARLAEQNQTQTLLRSSERPEGAPTQLLRPIAPQSHQEDAEQLLRAGREEPPRS